MAWFFITVSYFTNPNITAFNRVAVPLHANWTFLRMILEITRQPLPNPLCVVTLIAGHNSCRILKPPQSNPYEHQFYAPGPDMTWHVSNILMSHRSTGEEGFVELANHFILAHGPAFHPDQERLVWRMGKPLTQRILRVILRSAETSESSTPRLTFTLPA